MQKIIDNLYFEASRQGNLAVVTLKSEVFELITSLTESQVMMDFIREEEYDKSVRGLLLLNEPDCLGEDAYDRFLRSILKESDSPDPDVPAFLQKNTRFRQINILNKFISFLSAYHKPVIVGIGCTLVTPFMGVALVADFRLASPNAAFSLAHRNYGLHPSGAIPYLLAHYLGHSKAMELQFSGRITAEEAFRMGLVTQILPADNFRENCIRYVQPWLSQCRPTLFMTKRLNNFKNRWLDDYFEHETSLMNL
jgi:2-(1,2-epoxy-1,2-dihydrophenyl)acetyl-CoA isomerase